jgi:hypothetical protein
MGPPSAKGSYYGPSPDSLFKITHTPGKLTLVDRAVMREVVHNSNDKSSRRGSALFQSLRRYGSRLNDDQQPESPSIEFPSSPYSTPCYNDPQRQVNYEKHPLQFICSVATRNLINLHFETETPEEKEAWCNHLASVLNEHVQRDNTQQSQNENSMPYQRSTLSPSHSNYSFESVSSSESLAFSTAWTGYCDVEKMDVDEEQQLEKEKLTTGPPVIVDKNEEFLNTIMNEFDDSIWSIGAPPGMSPFQLRKTFSNIGSDI